MITTKPNRNTMMLTVYIITGCLIIPAYWYGHSIMTWFAPYIMVYKADATLNFFLLFFLYGVLCDKMTKKMSKRKGWIIWGAGLVILMLFFRFAGGYATIIG